MAKPKTSSKNGNKKKKSGGSGNDMAFSMASLVGACAGFSLVIAAIAIHTGNFLAFISAEGLMIVLGGTLAVSFMSYQASDVVEALKGLGLMFKKAKATHENLHYDLINIMAWAQIMKEKGLRGLEDEIDDNLKDPFVRYGLDMVVSNYTPDEVRTMMETAADAYYERGTVPATVLMAMAGHAPAFGMVGTLIGMVIMLGNFGGDMSHVGEGLSVALIATLYGVLSARLLYMPAASKIMQKQDNLRFRSHLITEGMTLLVAGKSPRYIQDRLNSYLKPGLHTKLDGRPESKAEAAPAKTAAKPAR